MTLESLHSIQFFSDTIFLSNAEFVYRIHYTGLLLFKLTDHKTYTVYIPQNNILLTSNIPSLINNMQLATHKEHQNRTINLFTSLAIIFYLKIRWKLQTSLLLTEMKPLKLAKDFNQKTYTVYGIRLVKNESSTHIKSMQYALFIFSHTFIYARPSKACEYKTQIHFLPSQTKHFQLNLITHQIYTVYRIHLIQPILDKPKTYTVYISPTPSQYLQTSLTQIEIEMKPLKLAKDSNQKTYTVYRIHLIQPILDKLKTYTVYISLTPPNYLLPPTYWPPSPRANKLSKEASILSGLLRFWRYKNPTQFINQNPALAGFFFCNEKPKEKSNDTIK